MTTQAEAAQALVCCGFETITVSTTSVGLTASKVYPSDGIAAKEAVVSVENASIRYRADGTDPTAAVGHPVASGQEIVLTGTANLAAFKAIRSGAADATLTVSYYR